MVLMGDVQLPLAAVREQVHAALDLVVHLARRRDGTRRRHGDRGGRRERAPAMRAPTSSPMASRVVRSLSRPAR